MTANMEQPLEVRAQQHVPAEGRGRAVAVD